MTRHFEFPGTGTGAIGQRNANAGTDFLRIAYATLDTVIAHLCFRKKWRTDTPRLTDYHVLAEFLNWTQRWSILVLLIEFLWREFAKKAEVARAGFQNAPTRRICGNIVFSCSCVWVSIENRQRSNEKIIAYLRKKKTDKKQQKRHWKDKK